MDKAFAKRLNSACDGHPHIPPYGQGRQTWIKEHLKVSHEAVRKWFTGESRPRPEKMKALAKTLEVDEAWLALGIAPDLEPSERRARNAQVEGAVNVFMGLVQLNGGSCALPGDRDPRAAYIDFYAIMRGLQLSFHVSLAQPMGHGQFKFILPKEYDQCTCIGAIHLYPLRLHFINLPYESIQKHATRRGGYYEIVMSKRDSDYLSGNSVWPRIHNFSNF